MSTAQVKYMKVSNERILELQNRQKANGITRKSSLYKNITLFLFTSVTVAFSVIILYGYLNIAQQNRKINTLNSEIRSLETERDDYNIQLEPYKSVERIAKLARLNYNMDFPKKEQVKYLDKVE
ncbi:MAG: septum formation initiator family protein [Peptoniphilaceae bacterium]|uniref:septum formation initiator family protein n=1 Tax=Parvimonas sp. TaxID=1944660 RepID=UPI0025FE8840|nr:septum formation initiator family protein [Parvimonas sp.]MCI5997975.1 septum formation initiator family protein [Parvimonas sp.]MDD7765097.1 septum formation initiator family protein [Peptoniphilaceae bacterium]MDY3051467.1 septum formation initiator family protein [Parvimonas sp.]